MKRLFAAALVLAAAPAAAQLDGLYVRGFVSQGYLNTSHNNYLVEESRDGTAEFHEAAVNLTALPAERLRVGVQFFARDFGLQGNNDVIVDWAYADYQWQDWLGFRFGKFKTTQGLYGRGRDIDMLRPTVLLPQAVYNEAHRDFILGAEGVGLYGNVPLKDGGGIDYEIYGGTLNVPDSDAGFWQDIFVETGQEIERGYREHYPDDDIRFRGAVNTHVHFEYLYGAAITWNCPISGLRLGVSGLTARFDMLGRLQFTTPGDIEDLPQTIELMMNYDGDLGRVVTFSAEWSLGRATLASELYQEKVEETVSEGYYVQGTLQLDDTKTLSSYYSRYVRDKNDSSGKSFVARGYPDFVAWQNDICLAVRVDPLDNLILKAEFHRVDGMGLLSPAHNDLENELDYVRHWNLLAAKATVHF